MTGLTIVLKCKDDPNVLKTISSIDHQAEVIVALVHNPSLRSLIERTGAKVIDAPDDNVGASCQLGLAAAKHEHIILSDSDTTFGAGYIGACLAALRENDLCRGRIRYLSDPQVTGSSTVAKVRDYFNNIRHPPYMPGLALRRSFALSAGGFDTDIGWGVDHEFGERALAAGGRYHFLDMVEIRHLPISTAHDLKAAARTGRAICRLDRKRGALRRSLRYELTSHRHEPYLSLLYIYGIDAWRHHFAWVRSFHAGYRAELFR